MKSEVKEIGIEVKVPESNKCFIAIVRDGELCDFDSLEETPTRSEIETYIQYCKEVLEEID
ncbi:hypothetical protein LCGC14_1686970 [marine sediment metagenome]|uniref:Uncharacterized protein n=1 Tax=marine sediment metagenome TaxID=412755 RepID=A0A0F9HMB7_9ZZZZ